ncbi:hypothetical protein N9X64_00115 [bacterium]|nr:hypothetical protein [bacterium]
MPEHKVLTPLEAEEVLKVYSLTIEELPALIYEDAALQNLRRRGEETPINSVVKITIVRSQFSTEDSDYNKDRTKIKYRVIKGV